jgi:hypothetical protein
LDATDVPGGEDFKRRFDQQLAEEGVAPAFFFSF